MPTYGPPPRRIVTSSTSIPANISDESSWEPAVIIIEEDIPRVSLLEDQAAKYPVHTHMRVPVDASDPYVILFAHELSSSHQVS